MEHPVHHNIIIKSSIKHASHRRIWYIICNFFARNALINTCHLRSRDANTLQYEDHWKINRNLPCYTFEFYIKRINSNFELTTAIPWPDPNRYFPAGLFVRSGLCQTRKAAEIEPHLWENDTAIIRTHFPKTNLENEPVAKKTSDIRLLHVPLGSQANLAPVRPRTVAPSSQPRRIPNEAITSPRVHIDVLS